MCYSVYDDGLPSWGYYNQPDPPDPQDSPITVECVITVKLTMSLKPNENHSDCD